MSNNKKLGKTVGGTVAKAVATVASIYAAELKKLDSHADKAKFMELAGIEMHKATGLAKQPVGCVRWVPIGQVQANDYNPNSVATNEMRLLYVSILHDGYTQPVVTVYDEEHDKYIIVDGFHRYSTMRNNKDILERCGGLLPIVVIDKSINDRMASTVRHNRARGKHSVDGMASMVFAMLDNGWDDAAICGELGIESEELVRLKHVTGFSKLFENAEYKRAWSSKRQLQLRKEYEKAQEEVEK